MTDYAIDTESLELLENVTQGLDFSVPSVDFDDPAFKIPEDLANALQKVPEPLTLDLLTECKIDGAGAFDKVMTSLKLHLQSEYEAQRITGAEYAKVYVAMMQYALQYAVQYLLGKDNAYYTALATQAQALTANLDAYTAKVRLAIAQSQAHISKAQYANEVLKLGAIDKQTDQVVAQTDHVSAQTTLVEAQVETEAKKPAQLEAQTALVTEQTATQEKQTLHVEEQTKQTTAQTSLITSQKDLVEAQTTTQEKQALHITAQTGLVTAQTETQEKQTLQVVAQTSLIEAQTETQEKQQDLLVEQTEQAHAQTSDTRLDGATPVTGYTGNQNKLLQQQVQSFKNDVVIKGSKMFIDSFATQLSMGSATVDNTGLDSSGIKNAVTQLQSLITNNS